MQILGLWKSFAEEGNAFDAGMVEGIEHANPPEGAEDDVPLEYLDTDEKVA